MVGSQLVSREAQDVGREFTDLLEKRDIGLAPLALLAAGGVVIADAVTTRVLPMLIDGVARPEQTGDPLHFVVAGGIKLALGLAIGLVAATMGGIGMAAAAFVALGSVVLGGADWLNALDAQFDILGGGSQSSAPRNATPDGGTGNSRAPLQQDSGGVTGLSSVG